MLRCSRDFDTVDDYTGFRGKVVDRRNRLVKEKLEQELPHLQCLPPSSGAGVRQLPGPGAQVEHHPGSRPDLHLLPASEWVLPEVLPELPSSADPKANFPDATNHRVMLWPALVSEIRQFRN